VCENWALNVKEEQEHKLRQLESREEYFKLRQKQYETKVIAKQFYSSANGIRLTKSRRIRWAKHGKAS
jgi:hypothetical protein